ncbi:hypothetical protein QBC38DRAFT_145280 [Podospora fimiseda]|uniref:Uncharacterized protein n=1 Tax=Podospora fimiseda TaxID=252190 RepID=A0AAN7BZ69_9PEZI|nr:hypothetical protein QBC38DRAFT_145280 [Podospora fimiseda]
MESSFTDVEKRFVLAEMIKASHMDVGVLVDFIESQKIQPDWLSMQLPGGRNMHQCLRAAETMFRNPMPPPVISPLKRKSFGDISDITDHVSKRQAVASPGEAPPHFGVPPLFPSQVSHPPRPNGAPSLPPVQTASAPHPPAPATTPWPGPPRKRGRPPKSESRQNSWQVTTSYPPISPAPPPSSTQGSAPASAPVHAHQPNSPSYNVQSPYRHSMPSLQELRMGKKQLPDIAPRPTPGQPSSEPGRSPTGLGAEYQERREDHQRQEQPQHGYGPRPPPLSAHTPILPRPRSPHMQQSHHMRETSRPRETPPMTPLESIKHE